MSDPSDLEEASISIPSVAFVVVLGFLIYRYFFAPSSTTTSSRAGAGSSTTQRFTTQQVDQVSSMFPQLNRRDIMWDLHRNRGNVAATTERVLSGGRLETAPPSFIPVLPTQQQPPPPITSSTNPSAGATTFANLIPVEPDLITRYNLQARVDASAKGKEKEEPNHGWAPNKDDRQAMLKRRRDEMILAARRKMQEKDALAGTTAAS